jgi:hypothetical protein
MGLVGLVHVLWRRRLAVLAGMLVAIAIAVLGIERGAGAAPATSSLTKILIDTPKSLVADAKARGAETIYTRARLVGALLAGDDARAAIARRAGLRPSELAIAGPGSGAPPDVITPLAEQAIAVAKPVGAYLVSVEVAPELPIVSITANAPSREGAVKLGEATVATLSSVAQSAPGGGGVTIEQLGGPLVETQEASRGRTKVVGGALVFFGAWCIGCILFDGASRRRRLRRTGWPPPRQAGGGASA